MTTGTLYLVPNLLGAIAPETVLPTQTLDVARRLTHWAVETPKPARAFLKTLALPRPIAELDIRPLPPLSSNAAPDGAGASLLQAHTLPTLSPRGRGCPEGAGEGEKAPFYPSPPAPLPQGERGAKYGARSQTGKHAIQKGSSVADISDALTALLAPCLAGADLGILTDAGCPGVADPGAPLVALAHRCGVPVKPLVGPSSLLLALMAAGMNGQRFTFHGYLPIPEDARAQTLRRLEQESRQQQHATQIFIETPYRNAALLAAITRALHPDSRLCVAADLTLPSESVITRPVREWRAIDGAGYQKRPAIFLLQA